MSGIYDDRLAYSPEEWQRLDNIGQELREAVSEQSEPKMCPECHSLDKGKPLHHNGQVACHHPWHSTGSQSAKTEGNTKEVMPNVPVRERNTTDVTGDSPSGERASEAQTGGNDARTANSDRVLSADSSICSQSVAMSAREFQQSTEWHDTLKANLPKSLTDHECLFAESYAAEVRSRLRVLQRFVQHIPGCVVYNKGQLNPCNCGLGEALFPFGTQRKIQKRSWRKLRSKAHEENN